VPHNARRGELQFLASQAYHGSERHGLSDLDAHPRLIDVHGTGLQEFRAVLVSPRQPDRRQELESFMSSQLACHVQLIGGYDEKLNTRPGQKITPKSSTFPKHRKPDRFFSKISEEQRFTSVVEEYRSYN
jgi:hypothetical protein